MACFLSNILMGSYVSDGIYLGECSTDVRVTQVLSREGLFRRRTRMGKEPQLQLEFFASVL